MSGVTSSARLESVRLIAHALEALDANRKFDLQNKGGGLLKVSVTDATEAEYLAWAEQLLDREIIRVAEETILCGIRLESMSCGATP